MNQLANIPRDKMRILLVEDNPAHAELIIRSLEDHEIPNEINHVSDGEAALHFLHREGKYKDPNSSPRPDLILLDIRMPKIDGLEVLKRIRSNEDLEPIPTVILTTSGAERDVLEAYRLHANSYLVKPLDFGQFERLMDDLGFYWLAWNYRPPVARSEAERN
jgi:two-component system response regulator